MGQTATGHFDGAGTGVDTGGGMRVLRTAGAPSAGVDEVQTITLGGTPTGGTFRLAFNSEITAAITWSATNATLLANIETALEALTGIGATLTLAVTTMVAGIGDATITFTGAQGKRAQSLITVYSNSLTGTAPTVAIAETTAGVTATFRGVQKGALLLDETNGTLYQNTGTTTAPTWTAR